jgi:hypothetical protein
MNTDGDPRKLKSSPLAGRETPECDDGHPAVVGCNEALEDSLNPALA